MTDFLRLPPRSKSGDIHLVVETPRGSRAKYKYEPGLGTFLYSRPLAHGVVYPFDWGFVPSTCAPDGDPLDGMILHEAASPQGVIIPCRILAVLEVEQAEGGETRRNDRLIFVPAVAAERGDLFLSDTLKRELCQFFSASVFGTRKKLVSMNWNGESEAQEILRDATGAFTRSAASRPLQPR
jgi:inorganic pyrophosphatase